MKKRAAVKWVGIALILCLISMIGASLVQTSGGKIKIKDLRWETSAGFELSGLLFIPPEASADNPVPAIVASHGKYNNREMQDLNYVELSRRGFVVLAFDMPSHGYSDNISSTDNANMDCTVGMYEAVKLVDTLAYVDSGKIGITGHSLGANSSNVTVATDNLQERQLVSAVLLSCWDAVYADAQTGEYTNIYGNRDVGLIAVQYDEWFFRTPRPDGTTAPPREYMQNINSQSFLHFGSDPASQSLENRTDAVIYHQEIDGVDAIRVVYTPAVIHAWAHFSKQTSAAASEFFTEALGAPNPIDSNSQIWQLKVLFNLIGVIGFGIFIVAFTILLLYAPIFESLHKQEDVKPISLDKKGKIWFWGGLAASVLFSTLIYTSILSDAEKIRPRALFMQEPPFGIGMWSLLCGLFTIVIMVISYQINGKSNELSLSERGVFINAKTLGKTILLALVVVAGAYGLVFIADYFCKTDFRVWTLALKAFDAEKLVIAIPYLLLFLPYYIANSVSINSFNYNNIGKPWLNTAILAASNAIPPAILLLIQYSNFFITGELLIPSAAMSILWLFPIVVILPATAVISRKIYRMTNNPYLAGLINGIIVVILSCSNTLTAIS